MQNSRICSAIIFQLEGFPVQTCLYFPLFSPAGVFPISIPDFSLESIG